MNEIFKPIYIVGNSRSGTTLMSRILKANTDIFVFRELNFFEVFYNGRERNKLLKSKDARRLASELICIQKEGYQRRKNVNSYSAEAERLLSSSLRDSLTYLQVYKYFLQKATKMHGRQYPCEQTPRYVFYLNEIFNAFPEARILNMVRDPRAVLLSQKMKWKRRKNVRATSYKEVARCWSNYHPLVISKLWNSAVKSVDRFKNDKRVFSVRFENLLENPEQIIRKICRFLNVGYDSAMLQVGRKGSSILPDEAGKIGFRREVSDQWKEKLSNEEIYLCQKINNNVMVELGYLTINSKPNYLALLSSFLFMPLKSSLSLLLNTGRTGNVANYIKRRIL